MGALPFDNFRRLAMVLSSWPFSRPGDMLQLYVLWDMVDDDGHSFQPYIFYMEE